MSDIQSVKGELQQHFQDLWHLDGEEALLQASQIITPDKAQAYFEHAGYVMCPLD